MNKLVLALALTMLTSVASATYSKIINCKTMFKAINRVIHTDGIDGAVYALKQSPRAYVCAMTDYDGGDLGYVSIGKDADDPTIIELSIPSDGKATMDIYELTYSTYNDYYYYQIRTFYHTGIESDQEISSGTYWDKIDDTRKFINGL